jgi:hypothetical protein
LLGFILFLSSGSAIISNAFVPAEAAMRGLGSLQILTSFLYLVDLAFSIMNVAKSD